MPTIRELRLLRTKGLNTHPWQTKMRDKIIMKVRHELGYETQAAIVRALATALATKDPEIWYAAVDPLIKAKENEDAGEASPP